MFELSEKDWNTLYRVNQANPTAEGSGNTRYRAGLRELCRVNKLTGELEWVPVRIRPPAGGGPRGMDWGAWLSPTSPEWERTWAQVDEKYGPEDPENDPELWQYMGTVRTETLGGGFRFFHEFRRRGYTTPEGEVVPRVVDWIPADPEWVESSTPPEARGGELYSLER